MTDRTIEQLIDEATALSDDKGQMHQWRDNLSDVELERFVEWLGEFGASLIVLLETLKKHGWKGSEEAGDSA